MAGDWLKMRHDIGDDPATIRIAALCGLDEDAVVGKLHRIWSWADRHTADGHAEGIGLAWVDRTVRCDGFGAAMVSVGWMEETESGMAFPRFDRHCGNTAKVRALAKTRMERARCAPSATETEQPRNKKGTREEKRREEEENQHARAAGTAGETPPEAKPEPGAHSSDCQNAAGRPQPDRGDTGAAASANSRHGAAGDEWRRAGWVHDEWARVVTVWNRTERAAPWTLATPPNGFAELAASPGWIDTALAGIAMLAECRRFARPVPWTQFVRELDRILAGEFRELAEPRRELTAAGGARQQRRGNL
jgi:hypothetical protein